MINITDSYEGLEAYDIEINGGTIKIVSSDDGLNAAGGDGSGNFNPGGWGPGNMNTSSGILNISGGYIFVRAEGDGVDSNGNLNISGGTTIICDLPGEETEYLILGITDRRSIIPEEYFSV